MIGIQAADSKGTGFFKVYESVLFDRFGRYGKLSHGSNYKNSTVSFNFSFLFKAKAYPDNRLFHIGGTAQLAVIRFESTSLELADILPELTGSVMGPFVEFFSYVVYSKPAGFLNILIGMAGNCQGPDQQAE